MSDVTDEEKYQDAKREVGLRYGVYAKLQKIHGRSLQNERRIAVMQAIADDYLRKIAPGLDLQDLKLATTAVETAAGAIMRAPLVLYFDREEDREGMLTACKSAFPNGFRSVKI